MIIVMKQNAPLTEIERLEDELREKGFQVDRSRGSSKVVLGLVGDTTSLDERDFLSNEWVDKVMRVQEPYKRASRAFHPQDSVIDVAGVKVGGKKLVVMVSLRETVTQRLIGIITVDIFPKFIQRHGIQYAVRQIDLGRTLLTEILPLHCGCQQSRCRTSADRT